MKIHDPPLKVFIENAEGRWVQVAGPVDAEPEPTRPAPAPTLTRLDLARLPVWSCDYRIALVVAPEGEPGEVGPLGCGCSRPALCLLGRAHRPDGIATDGDCAECMRFDG